MPELPDVTVYVEALHRVAVGRVLERARVVGPFFLRTAVPPLAGVEGRRLVGARRLGKRVVLAFEGDLFLVIHLMIAGRLRWRASVPKLSPRTALAAFEFGSGVLLVTEAGSRKRASLHMVEGEAALREFHAGGVEPLACDLPAFASALRRENRTLKRGLTDPRLVSGVGNAYSDEILHHARISPVRLTSQLSDEEMARLFESTRVVLTAWTERLRGEVGEGFPEKVTAFREGMAVHGRFGKPCPDCGAPVQRIVRAESEANYCVNCQTGGKVLADRGLSRLLRKDWPRTLEELERRLGGREG